MNTLFKTFKFIFAQLVLIVLIAVSAISAQTNSVDLSFNAVPDKNSTSVADFIIQPDNKVIAFGDFRVVNGVINNRIARLNTDGSVDTAFNCAICDFTITSAVLQPDGKIIIAGNGNDLRSRIYRLNPDGSRDESFTSPFITNFSSNHTADVQAVLPDGKILVVFFQYHGGRSDYILYRLNPNGSFDNTWTPGVISSTSGSSLSVAVSKIAALPNGKILVAFNTLSAGNNAAFLRRFNADGSVDSTFESLSLINSGGNPNGTYINDFETLADGSLIIVGRFTAVNGVSRLNTVKLLPAGSVDLSFNSSVSGQITGVELLSNNKVLVSTSNRFYRLNADGNPDNSFISPTNITLINRWTLDSAGRVFFYGLVAENNATVNKFVRLNQDGSIENSFATSFGVGSTTTAIAVQNDGKIVFSGTFHRVNGVPSRTFARVNADGSTDTTFHSEIFSNVPASKILIQPDGKILAIGNQFSSNGILRLGLIRLNADGTLETSFNPNISFVSFTVIDSIALQPDGKILIAGVFNAVNGQARTGIARLNNDGSLDASFNPTFGNPTIKSILVQPDGKILVGGIFSGVNGFSRTNLVRLNADGSLDSSFTASIIQSVNQIEVQANGKYLVLTGTILRLNNNGANDPTFISPQIGGIDEFLAQPDGTILIGGSFYYINNVARRYFARLRPNGTLDTSFFPSGANEVVRTFARQADGRVLIGGDFSAIGGVTRFSIARLIVSQFQAPYSAFDFDGDRRADVSVFRPSNGNWYILPSGTNAFYGFPFGQAGDQTAPADYDGDGKTDIAVFRDIVPGAGNFAYFYILNSSDNSFRAVQFGATGDVPMAGDWDGDGRVDLAVYRAASAAGGQSFFYYRPSSQPNVNFNTIPLGTAGDKPLVGDFDGDGRLDPAVFRPSTATWIILRSSVNQINQITFGVATDIPVPADYDGDGITNIAVFRPSNGTWYTSQDSAINFGAIQFGANGDVPVPADYDGDGRADTAVFRPSNGAWYLNRTTSGFIGVQFGANGDKPSPYSYIR